MAVQKSAELTLGLGPQRTGMQANILCEQQRREVEGKEMYKNTDPNLAPKNANTKHSILTLQ